MLKQPKRKQQDKRKTENSKLYSILHRRKTFFGIMLEIPYVPFYNFNAGSTSFGRRRSRCCTRTLCGEGMLLKPSSKGGSGSCTCGGFCYTQCWGKPFILVGEKCYKVATRVINNSSRRVTRLLAEVERIYFM